MPALRSHLPTQQSALDSHVPPGPLLHSWTHLAVAVQVPGPPVSPLAVQQTRPSQQSPFLAQASPDSMHCGGGTQPVVVGAQMPGPLGSFVVGQQTRPSPQELASPAVQSQPAHGLEVSLLQAQVPPLQSPWQQSPAVAHDAPGAAQAFGSAAKTRCGAPPKPSATSEPPTAPPIRPLSTRRRDVPVASRFVNSSKRFPSISGSHPLPRTGIGALCASIRSDYETTASPPPLSKRPAASPKRRGRP